MSIWFGLKTGCDRVELVYSYCLPDLL
jgi:hypothetical protein